MGDMTLKPGIEWLIENEIDGSILILVPGGKFLAWDYKLEADLPGFYVAMSPVTNAQYKRFVEATGHRRPDKADSLAEFPAWRNGCFPVDKENHPVVCVNREDAVAYCTWAGGRLPTAMEWWKAAHGTDGRKYPWGNEYDESKYMHGGDPLKGRTCDVWQHPQGCSPWGLYQMAGEPLMLCEDGIFSCFLFEYHRYLPKSHRSNCIGFRLARTLVP